MMEDYVSEKFFSVLDSSAVPLYYGAPNVDLYAPYDHSFINGREFTGRTQALSDLLCTICHFLRLKRYIIES